jgi:uncharacterized protein (DUF1330 family)
MVKLAFAVLAGAALGVGATQMLHAQAKPPAYLVTDITVTDDAKFKAWGERINPTFEKRGAKYLARGGQTMLVTGSSLTESPKRTNIIVFDSFDKAKEWDSAEDTKAARAIDRGATFRSYIVEGLPVQ